MDTNDAVHGEFTMCDIDENGIWTPGKTHKNKLMVSWGYAAAKTLGQGDGRYRINVMYIEFHENPGNSLSSVSTPAYTKFDSTAYYKVDLAGTSNVDYLRVELDGQPNIEVAPGYEPFFGAASGNQDQITGNRLHFTARTPSEGTATGIHGTSFGTNSIIYGVALVASPILRPPVSAGENTQDVLISRGYFEAASQRKVTSGIQVGVTWDLTFPPAD